MRKLLLIAFVLSAFYVKGQNSITGIVTDADSKESIPGVTVMVLGTSTGTTTDIDGKYTISAEKGQTIAFSFIGYASKNIIIENQLVVNVSLLTTSEMLNEYVVIGYGVQKKSDVTGALSKIDGEAFEETHSPSIANIIQGRASGVSVISNSGAPGRKAEINIRGLSSINGAPPLWIVDGVPTDGGVNPLDIESMEILKDASATAIYGTKGAGGVIIVTTKKGESGFLNLTYENRFAWGNMYKTLDLTNAKDWARLRSEAYSNAGLPIPPDLEQNFGEGTDWQNEINRTAFSMNHFLSASGGSEKLTYYMSINHSDQQGIIQKSDMTNTGFRINTSAKIKPWLKIGENISASKSKIHLINENDEWNSVMIEAMAIDPITKVRKEDGSWDGSRYNNMSNPVAHLARTNGENQNFVIGGNVFAEISFLKDFNFTSRLGFSQIYNNYYNFIPTFFVKTGEENNLTVVQRDFYEGKNWVFSNFLTWQHQYGIHNVKLMMGYEAEQNYGEWFGVSASNLISEAEHLIFIDNATGNQDASSFGLANDIRYESMFGRLNYDYASKYFVTVNFRRQGSSMFGPDYRYGMFPSASVGWKISDEGFFDNVAYISNLKLRVGYGVTGNDQALEPYSYYAVSNTGQRYVINGTIVNGVAFPKIPNPELHWEQKVSSDIGLDLRMFDDKLTFVFDYFVNQTNDMLFNPDLPGHVGTQDMPYTNVASMENKGFEFSLGYKASINKFKYDIMLNFTHVKNEVTGLGSATYINDVTFMQLGYISRTEVGHSMGSFYGYLTDGLFQNQAEIDAHVAPDGSPIQRNVAPGDIRYKADADGKLEMDFIGDPFPDFSAGLNINLNYKNFNLLMFFYGVYGNEIFNATKFYTHNSSVRYNVSNELKDRWLLEGDTDNPDLARLNINDANNTLRSDRYVEDGSYLRLKTLQLEYRLPENLFSKLDLSALKVFAGAENLLTITNYTGYDPEVGIGYNNNPLDRGIDRARYPSPRVFYFGFNIKL